MHVLSPARYAFIHLTWLAVAVGYATWLPAQRPNIVLMITDDQGIGDFGANGNTVFRTPNLDALARESGSFRSFYVNTVCAPTRASLLTGRYNYRTRCIDTYFGRAMLEPTEDTLAERLAAAGYLNGVFGKWHLGDCYPMRPSEQGFAESLVHRGGGLAQASDPLENEGRYTNPILFRNNTQIQSQGYCTDVYFTAGMDFVTRAAQANRNFFLYLPTNAPHAPLKDVPESLYREYVQRGAELATLIAGECSDVPAEVDRLARIGAMITNIDENVGRLMQKLDDLHLRDNTIVVFMIDNGPATRRYVGQLRGMKGEMWDGGIRSPLWICWPGRIEPGTVREEPTAHIDVMPTLLDACGVADPAASTRDGKSLLPLLTNREATLPERAIVIQSHRGDVPVRYHHCMIRKGDWKLVHPSGFELESCSGEPEFELYDLADDPGEQHNVAKDNPHIVAELRKEYDRWFDNVSATRPDNYAPPRIHVGTPHENPTVLTRQDWRRGDRDRSGIGQWELLCEPGNYDVTIRLEKTQPQGAKVTFEYGKESYQAELPANADRITLSGMIMPAGPLSVRVTLTSRDTPFGPYQLTLHRR